MSLTPKLDKRGRFAKVSEGAFMAKVSISTQAPEFTSQDIHGNAVSLSDFANKKNVLLVFNRGFI